jgi:hypothetical protein
MVWRSSTRKLWTKLGRIPEKSKGNDGFCRTLSSIIKDKRDFDWVSEYPRYHLPNTFFVEKTYICIHLHTFAYIG